MHSALCACVKGILTPVISTPIFSVEVSTVLILSARCLFQPSSLRRHPRPLFHLTSGYLTLPLHSDSLLDPYLFTIIWPVVTTWFCINKVKLSNSPKYPVLQVSLLIFLSFLPCGLHSPKHDGSWRGPGATGSRRLSLPVTGRHVGLAGLGLWDWPSLVPGVSPPRHSASRRPVRRRSKQVLLHIPRRAALPSAVPNPADCAVPG